MRYKVEREFKRQRGKDEFMTKERRFVPNAVDRASHYSLIYMGMVPDAVSKTRSPAQRIAVYAVMTALLCICAQIAVPLPFTQVPVSLAMLPVYLTGALLGPAGVLPVIVYLAMGALGLPVFAGFGAGLGHLAGPTGGYLIGYILTAASVGIIVKLCGATKPSLIAAFILGLLLCYAAGTIWYSLYTGVGFLPALFLCVLPFLPGDALKIALAVFLTVRLRKIKRNPL